MTRLLTNDIVENFEQCGNSGACLWFSYHDATTGKYLIGYALEDYFSDPGHVARVSPDERWFALSTSLIVVNGEVGDTGNKLMVMYDLKYHQKRVWATSDYSFAFSGWASDSREFYFVRYPLEGQKPGTLLGLIALDPFTLKTKVVIPNVLLANESPNHHSAFVITAGKIETQPAAEQFQAPQFQVDQLQAAVYTLDGKRTTPLQAVTDSLRFEGPASTIIPSEWSHKSNQVVFADNSGNLWLFNSEGKSSLLASRLPTEEWPNETAFYWSPDDRRLFVYRAHRAWVVDIN